MTSLYYNNSIASTANTLSANSCSTMKPTPPVPSFPFHHNSYLLGIGLLSLLQISYNRTQPSVYIVSRTDPQPVATTHQLCPHSSLSWSLHSTSQTSILVGNKYRTTIYIWCLPLCRHGLDWWRGIASHQSNVDILLGNDRSALTAFALGVTFTLNTPSRRCLSTVCAPDL